MGSCNRYFPRQTITRLFTAVFAGILLAVLFVGWSVRASEPPAFRVGDRWCAVGDSITHEGSYHTAVQLFYRTRFPDRPLKFVNCGISGDTAAGALRRVDWDILANQPTVVTVLLGMNDIDRKLYRDPVVTPETESKRRTRIEEYRVNLRLLVATLQAGGARVVLFTPSPFDDTAELAAPRSHGVNAALAVCAGIVREIGAETDSAVIDLHGPMTRLDRQRQASQPEFTLISPDRIHPAAPGSLVMAYLILRAQDMPGEVARLSLDAAQASVVAAANGEARDVRRPEEGLTFTWTARALPYPVFDEVAPALDWVPLVDELNREILQVTHLPPGEYALRIDGREIRRYSAADLAQGVNLATEHATPQYQQALAVATLVRERAAFEARELRGLALFENQVMPTAPRPLEIEAMRPVVAKRLAAFRIKPSPWPLFMEVTEQYLDRKEHETALRAELARMEAEADRAACPVAHDYVLRRVGDSGGKE